MALSHAPPSRWQPAFVGTDGSLQGSIGNRSRPVIIIIIIIIITIINTSIINNINNPEMSGPEFCTQTTSPPCHLVQSASLSRPSIAEKV